ncbi:MAG: type III PLP-dependent enzyme, partial [Alphaproteobacteria bacterium]|nr:type III PLP-dependent enzyme [Alphaproteobacteria bacterium]
PLARIYYAVKANPAPEILSMLAQVGSAFDVASPAEVRLCLDAGVTGERISFGNTIKKKVDIAYAYEQGVRLYAFDSEAELEKLAVAAPGARVFCRILMTCDGAEWPLSRKFGCEVDMAADLLKRARDLGLEPYGVSFHVGSQQTDLGQWDIAVGKTRMLFTALNEAGIELKMINLGGGFPARYRKAVAGVDQYANAVMHAMTKHFGNALPEMIIEPGRSLVGDAGVLEAEVVLISRKGYNDNVRWVYLDVGKFGGLAETMDEAIKYRIETDHDGAETGPVVLAGPTCDSADILYEKAGYEMPLSLAVGDKVRVLATGAYTASYSAVNFNGFEPLKAYFV